jgi:AcrR family transcriptional regulator
VDEAGTPWGSISHHFPGGKEELGVAALSYGSDRAVSFLDSCFERTSSAPAALRRWFEKNADALERTEFELGCPIAAVAVETATTSPALAAASGDAFQRLVESLAGHFEAAGIDATRAHELAVLVFTSFEGALLLARTTRSSEPLRVAGKQLDALVRETLAS